MCERTRNANASTQHLYSYFSSITKSLLLGTNKHDGLQQERLYSICIKFGSPLVGRGDFAAPLFVTKVTPPSAGLITEFLTALCASSTLMSFLSLVLSLFSQEQEQVQKKSSGRQKHQQKHQPIPPPPPPPPPPFLFFFSSDCHFYICHPRPPW